MDIFFHDPDDVPLPPDEVRIRQFAVQPYADGRRVRVYLEITPFQKKPSAEITLYNSQGELMGNVSIIETIDPRMEMTMHLRGAMLHSAIVDDQFTARADLFYEELPEEPNGQLPGDLTEYKMPERVMVDHAEAHFDLHQDE